MSESDFSRGNAAAYKVILDTNTSIMDDAFVDQIEKYVSGGGIFITFATSGRHSPTKPDSWSINRLTGYDVLTQERFDAKGSTLEYANDPNPAGTPSHLTVAPASGQHIYLKSEQWMNSPFHNGLRLKKRLPDVQDLLLWKDGTVAVGMRKIGKGAIINFGCDNGSPYWPGLEKEAFLPIFTWAGVRQIPVNVSIDKPNSRLENDYNFRSYVSNNGLFNLMSIWNPSRTEPIKATFTFREDAPTSVRDVVNGQVLSIQNGKLSDVLLAPMETRVFISPRHEIANAASEWFDLQHKWWRALTPGDEAPSPSVRSLCVQIIGKLVSSSAGGKRRRGTLGRIRLRRFELAEAFAGSMECRYKLEGRSLRRVAPHVYGSKRMESRPGRALARKRIPRVYRAGRSLDGRQGHSIPDKYRRKHH